MDHLTHIYAFEEEPGKDSPECLGNRFRSNYPKPEQPSEVRKLNRSIAGRRIVDISKVTSYSIDADEPPSFQPEN